MPSIQNPAHYERCAGVAESEQDPFFRQIGADDAEDDTGSTESPFGWVVLVRLDDELIGRIVNEHLVPMGYAEAYRVPKPGWYIIRCDDNGLVWGIEYGPLDDTLAEEKARADFAEAEAAYVDWLSIVAEPEDEPAELDDTMWEQGLERVDADVRKGTTLTSTTYCDDENCQGHITRHFYPNQRMVLTFDAENPVQMMPED